MSKNPWTRETRIRNGLPPERPIKDRRDNHGRFVPQRQPAIDIPPADVAEIPRPVQPKLPPVDETHQAENFFNYKPNPPDPSTESNCGEEIHIDDPPPGGAGETTEKKEEQKLEDEKADQNTVKLESLFSEEEIEELLVMIWQDGGNFFLKKARRELISDAEALKLGEISMMVFKKRFGNKIQAIPELYLICYLAMVLTSKDKISPENPDYVPPPKKPKEKKANQEEDAELVGEGTE